MDIYRCPAFDVSYKHLLNHNNDETTASSFLNPTMVKLNYGIIPRFRLKMVQAVVTKIILFGSHDPTFFGGCQTSVLSVPNLQQ